MSISAVHAQEQSAQPSVRAAGFVLRAVLLAGCVAALTLAAWIGNPAPYLSADVDLGRLLQGMALIKAGIVFAAISLLWWRFKRPVPVPLAAIYLIGTCLAAGASMLIWQLTAIPLAAITFHAGGLAFLVAAWLDYKTSTDVRAAWSFFRSSR